MDTSEDKNRDKNETFSETKKHLFSDILCPPSEDTRLKVTVVGAGQVGMACAFSLLTMGVTNDIVLIDTVEDKVNGECLDLQHGALFMKNPRIIGGTDYALTAGSRLCVVTAGARQREEESRLELLQRNADIMRFIIPQLVHHSPDTMLLMVANPVDILTFIAWRISGLPRHRVIGSGTNLDSSRFRYLLSEKLEVAPSSVHGFIIGEHGDSSVPVWSGVNVGGVRLRDVNPSVGSEQDDEDWNSVHRDVVQSAYKVIRLKGYTNWAIGLSVADIAMTITRNMMRVHAVSVNVQGLHDIKEDVYLSLPAILGSQGVCKIISLPLSIKEKIKLHESAEVMEEQQKKLELE